MAAHTGRPVGIQDARERGRMTHGPIAPARVVPATGAASDGFGPGLRVRPPPGRNPCGRDAARIRNDRYLSVAHPLREFMHVQRGKPELKYIPAYLSSRHRVFTACMTSSAALVSLFRGRVLVPFLNCVWIVTDTELVAIHAVCHFGPYFFWHVPISVSGIDFVSGYAPALSRAQGFPNAPLFCTPVLIVVGSPAIGVRSPAILAIRPPPVPKFPRTWIMTVYPHVLCTPNAHLHSPFEVP